MLLREVMLRRWVQDTSPLAGSTMPSQRPSAAPLGSLWPRTMKAEAAMTMAERRICMLKKEYLKRVDGNEVGLLFGDIGCQSDIRRGSSAPVYTHPQR